MTYDQFLASLDAQNALLRDFPANQIFTAIFDKQAALDKKYGEIERANGFYAPMCDEHIVFNMEQTAWIRSKFWFATEEISEALDALHPDKAELFFEELIDALHYMVEVSLFVDPKPNSLDVMYDTANRSSWGILPDLQLTANHIMPVIYHMGMAANNLKAKPWRQGGVAITPEQKQQFLNRLSRAWLAFLSALKFFGFTKTHIYVLYCHKNEINQQRQHNGY